MKEVKISIIVPVYNVDKYLAKCLESVIGQNYKNLEVICVYAEANDKSFEILSRYQTLDSRIKIYKQKGCGLSGARNEGLSYASGDYIWFLDSDDWLCNGALERMNTVLCDKDIEILCFNAKLFYESAYAYEQYNMDSCFQRKADYSDYTSGAQLFEEMMKRDDFCVPVWMMLLKRQWLLEKEIVFGENLLHEDNQYTFECYLNAERVKYITDDLYVYRIREGSLARRQRDCNELKCFVIIADVVLSYLKKGCWSDNMKCEIAHYYKVLIERSIECNRNIDAEEKREFEIDSPLIDAYFKAYRIGKYEEEEFQNNIYYAGFEWYLKKYDKIVIYGAGYYGKRLLSFVTKRGLYGKVAAFVVTDTVNCPEHYNGIPIKKIEDFSEEIKKEKMLIILAVDICRQAELIKKCEELQLVDQIRLDKTIQHYLITQDEEEVYEG